MNTISVVIIDDESAAVELLSTVCASIEDLTVSGVAYSVEEGVEKLEALKPDIVLLDIEFPDGSGFDILEKCKTKGFHIIFTTAHQSYAIKAFKHFAFDYILKPISPAEVKDSLNRAKAQIRSNHKIDDSLAALLQHLKHPHAGKFAIPIYDGYRYVEHDDIIFIKADGSYSHAALSTGEKLLISKKIGWIQDQLPSDRFSRIHKSHLVNINHITELHRGEGGYICVSSGDKLPLSRNAQLPL